MYPFNASYRTDPGIRILLADSLAQRQMSRNGAKDGNDKANQLAPIQLSRDQRDQRGLNPSAPQGC